GTAPDLFPAHTEVFQFMGKCECHFINDTEKVRLVDRYFYNREEFARFDSDVGRYEGFTPHGEKQAQDWNRNPQFMEHIRALVDTVCRRNYKTITPFSVERRVPVPPTPSHTLPSPS
ncbi:2B18 protein, partial [Catharus fuscescens]|nr:2B18 protein [Catharus fuscescens]